MLKLLFLTHRYLGIGLGLVMLLWCLSGFVMMYKPYPALSQAQSLALLPPLDLAGCCRVPSAGGLDGWDYRGFYLQMVGTLPVLHLITTDGRLVTIDLEHDRMFHRIPEDFAHHLALDFAQARGYPPPRLLGAIEIDQWTVYGAYNPHRPLYHVSVGDAAATQWYLSSRTGEIVQLTTREQRVWGYLGAVIHWLYPTLLRERVRLWSQVVIWLTIIGIFLTLTGLYFGLRQYRTRRSGRKSPYRGLSLWHHYAGLCFGLLTFTWVLSGLFSMNPWGLLDGEGAQMERAALRGGSFQWQTLDSLLPTISELALPADTVRLEGKILQGTAAFYSVNASGDRQRFNTRKLAPEPLQEQQLYGLAEVLSRGREPVKAELIHAGDNYYSRHHDEVVLPAYRVIANDGRATRYYLDPVNGEILSKIDSERKWYRWLFYGLHRGDFTTALRSRPVWDLFMWTLLLGVTGVCLTGLCMAYRRLRRSF